MIICTCITLVSLVNELQESFSAAKTAFRQFQVKTRANVARNHRGVSSLEGAVQDYINRNLDLLDTPGLVAVSKHVHYF